MAITYAAITNRTAYDKPAAPSLAAAGMSITDPVFGSVVTRVTDRNTSGGESMHVPSNEATSAWNTDGTRFFLLTAGGSIKIFSYPGLALQGNTVPGGNVEPCFSFVDPDLLWIVTTGSGQDTPRTLKTYRLSTQAVTTVLNPDADTGLDLSGKYVGSMIVVDNDAWVMAFGGIGQDQHYLVRHSGGRTFNTSTQSPAYHVHALAMDRTGRYVTIFTTSADIGLGVPHVQVWDTTLNTVTPMTVSVSGHATLGYGQYVNQDVASGTWDAAQWCIRSLTDLDHPTNLIPTVLSPTEVNWSDHSSWRANGVSGGVPIISGTYRYTNSGLAWRAWDDEIIAVSTDGTGTVYRFAHHHSDVIGLDFWDQPLVNVDATGTKILFTSNWGSSVGTGKQDVFLVTVTVAKGVLMAFPSWPFSNVAAPTYDSGLVMIDQPSLTAVTAQSLYLLGAYVTNPTTTYITFTLTNTAGNQIIGPVEVPAGTSLPPWSFPFMPCVGLKWQASSAGLLGQLWGY